MLTFAHAGHWLAQLAYLVPIAVVLLVAAIGRWRDDDEDEEVDPSAANRSATDLDR